MTEIPQEAPDSITHGESTIKQVIQHQAGWATTNGLAISPSRQALKDPASALFVGLCPETHDELRTGAGSELSRIHSLRSSSCLALNVFEPWRRGPRPLGEIFGLEVDSLTFEAKQPTGLKGVAPHLDVLLTGRGRSVAIESKFLEMYSPVSNNFAESYFATKGGLWDGMTNTRILAQRIVNGDAQFRWLHAAQLIKHALGLSKNQEVGFRLVLLWYWVDGFIAEQLEEEIGRFTRAVSDDIDFTSMTHQELVMRLRQTSEPMPGYFGYLKDRYLLDSSRTRRLPLLDIGTQPAVNHRRALDTTTQTLDTTSLAKSYLRTVARAPQRPLRRKSFLVSHDGGGGAASTSSEKVLAKALFNEAAPLTFDGQLVKLIGYEVPLRAHQADGGVGEIDLFGFEEATRRPWIIELKLAPNRETPLKALFQALRYSAIVDANRRAFLQEVKERFGYREVSWPAGLAVVADHRYWQSLLDTRPAGKWLPALYDLCESLEMVLDFEFALLDIGDVGVEIAGGRARLTSELAIRRLSEEGRKR